MPFGDFWDFSFEAVFLKLAEYLSRFVPDPLDKQKSALPAKNGARCQSNEGFTSLLLKDCNYKSLVFSN